MAVEAAARVALGIVEMHAPQLVHADKGGEAVHRRLKPLDGGEVIPGGVGVAGVDAATDALTVPRRLHDHGELLEGGAEGAARSAGVLDDQLCQYL